MTVVFPTVMHNTFYRLSRFISNHLQYFCLPPRKVFGLSRPVKYDLALKSPGICNILFTCGEFTLGKPICVSISGSRNTAVIFDYTNRKSQMLQNTVPTSVAGRCRVTPASCPEYPGAWTGS